MRVLHLTLKKKWFDLIASGEKKEEYREIKQYWWNRFVESYDPFDGEMITKNWDVVRFKNGYSKKAPSVDVEFIEVSIRKQGNVNWGFTNRCFVIKLGKVLSITTPASDAISVTTEDK